MTRAAIILAILLTWIVFLPAQIGNYYTFNATTETYAAITGTSVPTAVGDNVLSNPIDIGFTFNYGANSYTQIKISSNGYITLGTVPGSTPNNSLESSLCPVLAPLWDDTYLQGSAQYLLSGTAPNRVFTVQFNGVKWPTNTTTIFNYQVRIHESRTVEFIYGNSVGTPTNASASIGINMLPGGNDNYYSVTPGPNPTASTNNENMTVNTWPGTNTKYVFSTPVQFTNDLMVLSLTGNQTPTAGVGYNYTVAVRNNGTAVQTSYSVSIMAGATQLASVAGPSIDPQATINVSVPWTPANPGPVMITGKVVLTGDQNQNNNTSQGLSLVVQEAGTTALTIGDGSQLARKPVDMSYKNSMFQTIFPASEITVNGQITGVSFYNSFVENLSNKPTKIWLGSTTQTNLSSGWIPAFQMVQVFDGTINYSSGQSLIYVTFNPATPFNYTGGNLVMLVNRPLDTVFYSSANSFQCQTIGTNRSRTAISDVTNFDPNNMGTVGTVSGQFPKTTFYVVPAAVEPAFSVDPESHNFGQVILNNSQTQVFHVFNSGGGTLNISNISITGSPYFTLQNLPTLPAALVSGQFSTFSAQYLPTTAGNHTATISITDNLTRLVHTVALSGSCLDPTVNSVPYSQAFDQATAPNLPVDWQKITTGTGTVTTVTTSPFTAPNCVLLNNSNSALGPFLIAPPMASTLPVNTLKIRFRAKGASGFSINVGVLSNPQDATSYTPIQNVTLANDWIEYQVDLRSYTGTGSFIAFKHSQGGNNRNIYIDNVVIEALLLDDLAATQISGSTTPNAGTPYNYSISIYNWGLNAQEDYQVKLYKTGNIELASAQGPALAGNSQATVVIPWTPTTMENTVLYGKVVLAADQNSSNNQTPNLNVTVQESTTTLVVVGTGNQSNNEVPVNMYALTSLYENIYRQDELNQAGLISIINFYNFFTSNIAPKPTRIWLGMTDQTDLANGWIPSSQLSLVFDGLVNYPAGVNTIPIVLQQPFTLLQGSNLVMMVERVMDTSTYSSWENFFCQTDGVSRSRRASSSQAMDPNNPPAGALTGQFPKTGFYITPGGAGNLNGTVYGADNQPLANATVHVQNGPQTVTNASGQYSFPGIFARDYSVTASHHGYDDLIQYVSVLTDSTAVLDFMMSQTPTVTVTGTLFGSDTPGVGLAGAVILLSGYENYQAVTNAEGHFSITGVYAGHSYQYQINATGYQGQQGSIEIGTTDYDLGNIILLEQTSAPSNVNASISNNHTSVEILWFAPTLETKDRDLVGYKVWRLTQGMEENEDEWTLLTPETITPQRFTDTGWNTLPQGIFRWAVKSIYTSNVMSSAALSNPLQTTGILTGVVRNAQSAPVMGATVSTGTHSALTAADGSYTLHLPGGSYTVSCAFNGYYTNVQYNVVITVGQTTTLDFAIVPVANADENLVTVTRLYENYPNPFNPTTTISYDIKDATRVLLQIFNLKGQLVRSLVNERKSPGHYNVIWDGKDERGTEVSSGIYQYRILAGEYRKTNRMTLQK